MDLSVPAPARRDVNYGTRARVGMMLTSQNTVAEPQIGAMLPAGVSLHTTRLHLDGEGDGFLRMLDRLEEAASLLADAQVTRIAFHCTAVSMWSPDIVGEIRERVAAVTPIPVVITSDAIVEAFETLGARCVVLVSPYVQAVNDREVRFLASRGIEVLRERGLGITGGRAMAEVEPERWYRETLDLRDERADAYFLSCTAIRSAEAIDALEAELGRPVVTSNQAMLWRALREAGIDDAIAGFGTLLRER